MLAYGMVWENREPLGACIGIRPANGVEIFCDKHFNVAAAMGSGGGLGVGSVGAWANAQSARRPEK